MSMFHKEAYKQLPGKVVFAQSGIDAPNLREGCRTEKIRPAENLAVWIASSPEQAAELARMRMRVSELELQLAEVRRDVRSLYSRRSISLSSLGYAAVLHAKVIGMTESVFGSTAIIRTENDPESGETQFVVHVAAPSKATEICRLNDEWHGGIVSVASDLALKFRLDIEVE